MNLFQLVLKQMRQRSLSTWLTLLSVLLGVGLAMAIMIFGREGHNVFAQTEYGYDLVIGPRGSKLQLVLNSVYHIDQSPGTIPYSFYEDLTGTEPYRNLVRWAVPFAVGDQYAGHRVVATTTQVFGVGENGRPLPPEQRFEYLPGRHFRMAEGRVFHPRRLEAVIGAEVARRTGLRIGDRFHVEHGVGVTYGVAEHEEQWTIVGILEPTQTAKDRVLFIPLLSFYAIDAHHHHLEAVAELHGVREGASPVQDEHPDHPPQDHDAGALHVDLPPEKWHISGIWVQSRGFIQARDLEFFINNGPVAMAVNPAMEMRAFFERFLDGSIRILLYISLMVTVVAAVSILVSIYNSVSARRREIAILRALGATRGRILTLICVEAGLIGLVGGMIGLIVGHAIAGVGSAYLSAFLGHGIDWMIIGLDQLMYLGAVVVIAVIAGLVPALKAYRTPVATNLVSG